MDCFSMRSKIIIILAALLLQFCQQTPSTLDQEAYIEDTPSAEFSAAITDFEFDFLSRTFFFSVKAVSPEPDLNVTADLFMMNALIMSFVLNDAGSSKDILANDDSFDMSWQLPDSLMDQIESQWTLRIKVSSAGQSLEKSLSLEPELPAPPVIHSVRHRDTLQLSNAGLVIDTLTLVVSHPKGLDEIRDVSMMSLKPDGNYANNGQPIPLYDDGGRVVFFSFDGIDFTSGDKIAGDGTFSLLLALAPTNLSGTYYWSFNSRTWEGLAAIPVEDSLLVLAAPAASTTKAAGDGRQGVFQ